MSTTIGLHRTSVRFGPSSALITLKGVGGVGPGTFYPIGLTAGQLVMMIVNTKSYAIASSLVTGNTIDRTAAVPAVVGFFLTGPNPSFSDTVFSGMNNATINVFNGPAYLNPIDGLLYPQFQLIAGDGTNTIATNDPGGIPSGSTLSLFGSPLFNVPLSTGSGPLAPTSITINQNTVF